MIGGGDVRSILTALFAVLGAWYLAATARALWNAGADHGRHALGLALHALMSAAMISTFWSWGAGIPVIAHVTVFTAAAGWFAGQAVFGAGGHLDAGGHLGDGRYGNWYHAGMMAVMVWMAVAMPLMSPPSAGGAVPGSAMSGMSMPGGDLAGLTTGGPAAGGWPSWTGAASLVLAAALFGAAAWQAIAALGPLAAPGRGRKARPSWPDVSGVVLADGVGALMAAGMAVALLEMA